MDYEAEQIDLQREQDDSLDYYLSEGYPIQLAEEAVLQDLKIFGERNEN